MKNDPRSYDRNFCNCVKKPEKKFRTSTGLEPVTSRYRGDALPTELWSHRHWEQVNCFQFLESSIEGYIHTVSPIKTATNIEKTKYLIAPCKEKIRLVCYSPKKRIDISEACQKKSPIKITGTKRMLSKFDSQDHSILKSAKITPVVLDFQYDKE